jgi:hypothetical protein
MNGARVVLAAWRWLLALWIGELAIAAFAGTAVRAQVAAALGEFALPDDHLMYAVAELVGFHPDVVVAIVIGVVGSAVLAVVVWTMLAPLVIARLAGGARPAGELGAAWTRTLGGAIATSAWHLLLRAGLAFALVGSLSPLPPMLALAIAALATVVATAALDISRTQVVLHGGVGTSWRTAAWGYVHAVKRPRLLAVLAGAQLLQWACAAAGLALVVRSAGAAIGPARVLALLGTAIGLWRLHHVACAGAMPAPPPSRETDAE